MHQSARAPDHILIVGGSIVVGFCKIALGRTDQRFEWDHGRLALQDGMDSQPEA